MTKKDRGRAKQDGIEAVVTYYGLLHNPTNWKKVFLTVLYLSGCLRSFSHFHTDQSLPHGEKKVGKHTACDAFFALLLSFRPLSKLRTERAITLPDCTIWEQDLTLRFSKTDLFVHYEEFIKKLSHTKLSRGV